MPTSVDPAALSRQWQQLLAESHLRIAESAWGDAQHSGRLLTILGQSSRKEAQDKLHAAQKACEDGFEALSLYTSQEAALVRWECALHNAMCQQVHAVCGSSTTRWLTAGNLLRQWPTTSMLLPFL